MTKKNQKVRSDDKEIQAELNKDDFRVAIYGSARLKKGDDVYEMVRNLAQQCGKWKFDVVTGGGPGLMEAANLGHEEGDGNGGSDNIGLTIELPWEAKGNKHLEIKKHFNKFSDRLDHFAALSSVFVVMPGGIGTALELFYTWQLIQVKHIKPVPIIVVGEMWAKLIDWVRENPVKLGLVSPGDLDFVHVAMDENEAMEIILAEKEKFVSGEHSGNEEYINGDK
jgi:uncharacterized protein (TIGR00730 family)